MSAHAQTFGMKDTTFTRFGDLHSRLPEGEKSKYKPETLVAHQVMRPDGKPYDDDPDSPIVVLGDSFTGVYELTDAEHAGVSAHIARGVSLPDRSRDELRRRPQRAAEADAARGRRARHEEAGHLDDDGARPLRPLGELGAALGTMMRPIAALLVFALLWDGGAKEPAPKPVERALLAVARDAQYPGAPGDTWAAVELERIARVVREAIRARPQASPVDVLNETIFTTLGFVREVDDADLRFVLLPTVLKDRRGSCVGLGTLYLALGEALGWPAAGVMVPGHFFVRIGERGRDRNVELLRRGEEMPDAWYRTRFPAEGGDADEYMRPLTLSEVVGVVEYDVGGDRRRRGKLIEARRAFRRATRDFPGVRRSTREPGGDAAPSRIARRGGNDVPRREARQSRPPRRRREPRSLDARAPWRRRLGEPLVVGHSLTARTRGSSREAGRRRSSRCSS